MLVDPAAWVRRTSHAEPDAASPGGFRPRRCSAARQTKSSIIFAASGHGSTSARPGRAREVDRRTRRSINRAGSDVRCRTPCPASRAERGRESTTAAPTPQGRRQRQSRLPGEPPLDARLSEGPPAVDDRTWAAGLMGLVTEQRTPGGHVRLGTERDPLEVLRMGTYAGTCLGLGGGDRRRSQQARGLRTERDRRRRCASAPCIERRRSTRVLPRLPAQHVA